MKEMLTCLAALFFAALALSGCASYRSSGLEETDFNSTSETGDDTNSINIDTDATLGSFCNPLSLGTEAVTINLRIGSGADQVVLSASTGTCSNPLGQACTEIPYGPDIALSLESEDDQPLYTTVQSIDPRSHMVFFATLDDAGGIFLQNGVLNEALDCAQMECYRTAYNERTCDASDPCGWTGNGTCDDYCLEVLPDGQSMFDDSADCPAR